MAKSSPHLTPLSQAQCEIMEVVWEEGELSARMIRESLAKQGREIARNTVRTLIERMEEKGWLTHRVEGRTYYYSSAHPREATTGRKVLDVLDQICGGSPETLMSALINYRGLTPAELDRIQGMLKDEKSKTRKRGGKK